MSINKAEINTSLPVAVDAMGADFGPKVIVEGAALAARELGQGIVLVGDEPQLKSALDSLGASNLSISIKHAAHVITMEDSPSAAIRGKADSSVRVAFELVTEGKASALVSPGNTGAMMAAGVFVSGTLPGIARPAIASFIPNIGDTTPTILLDAGANVDCHAQQLVQFALMGTCYAASALSLKSPRVALLSNGTESSKGTDVVRSAAMMLRELEGINYIGYVEGRDVCKSKADVVVCDGFVGNILLKGMEGCVELVFDSMRHQVDRSKQAKLGLWLAKPMFKELFQDKLDPGAYGGAPLLGLNHIAVVCHGSSDARAIRNAVRVASHFAKEDLITKLSQALSTLDLRMPGYEDGIWGRMGQRFDRKPKARSADQTTGDSSLSQESQTRERENE